MGVNLHILELVTAKVRHSRKVKATCKHKIVFYFSFLLACLLFCVCFSIFGGERGWLIVWIVVDIYKEWSWVGRIIFSKGN